MIFSNAFGGFLGKTTGCPFFSIIAYSQALFQYIFRPCKGPTSNRSSGPVNKDLNLVALHHVPVLRDGVGHHHRLKVASLKPRQGVAREDTVGEDGVDFLGAVISQFFCCLKSINQTSLLQITVNEAHLQLKQRLKI